MAQSRTFLRKSVPYSILLATGSSIYLYFQSTTLHADSSTAITCGRYAKLTSSDKYRSGLDIGSENAARLAAKGVWIWGDNRFGVVSSSRPSSNIIKNPRKVPFLEKKVLRDLALHKTYAAAVNENGDVLVWGNIQETSQSATPILALTGKDISSVACASNLLYALSRKGSIYSVSLNSSVPVCQELQPNVKLDATISTGSWLSRMTSKEKFISISAGDDHLLALTSAGRSFATPITPAANEYGQLGVRRAVIAAKNYTTIVQKEVTLIPETISSIRGSRRGGGRELMEYSTPPTSPHLLPREQIEERRKQVELERNSSKPTRTSSKEEEEEMKRLLNNLPNTPIFSTTLHLIPSLRNVNVAQLCAGANHSLARTPDGYVLGWGCNSFGQLGLGPKLVFNAIPVPTQVTFDTASLVAAAKGEDTLTCTSVFAGGDSSYFVTKSQTEDDHKVTRYDLFSCGSGIYGGNGNGSYQHQFAPSKIKALSGLTEYNEIKKAVVPIEFSSISVGRGHVAAVLDDAPIGSKLTYGRDVYLWGLNSESQLGIGSRANVAIPRHTEPLPSISESNQKSTETYPDEDLLTNQRMQLCTNEKSGKASAEETIVSGWGNTAVYWRLKI